MKHKKSRQESTSEESNNSEESVESESSSESSVSEDSSLDERRHKRKRKKHSSSESESQSESESRPKKRKHKKKKKKHGKRKKHYEEGSESGETHSEKEVPKKKKKHKHGKHSKHSKSSANGDEYYEDEKRDIYDHDKPASAEMESPQQTYYHSQYKRLRSPEYVQREEEVQRFYRGSSKDKQSQRQTEYHSRDHGSGRYQYEKRRENYYNQSKTGSEYQSHKNYDEMRRANKYDDRYQHQEHHRQPREYHRGDPRDNHGPPHYKYQDRGPRKHYEHRDYEERRPGPPGERYQHRDYPDKRERYREEPPAPDRERDYRRSKPVRSERPPPHHHREHREGSASRSRESHRESRREASAPRSTSNRDEPQPRERRTRFADVKESDYEWGKTEVKIEDTKSDKEKPNFGLSGKLTEDANTVNGVVIKYTEPDDAKQPKRRWRFYPFKGEQALPILYIHRQSCFIMGRDKKVVDIHLEHPSVSKQHAALQYRATPFTRTDGSQGRRVRPYVIDLDSANGTFVNNKKIDARRYVELLERDVVKFGFSQREYVLLHENSKDDAQDDDNEPEGLGASVTTTAQLKQEKRAKLEKVEDGE